MNKVTISYSTTYNITLESDDQEIKHLVELGQKAILDYLAMLSGDYVPPKTESEDTGHEHHHNHGDGSYVASADKVPGYE